MSQKMANSFLSSENGNIVNITANVRNGFPGMAHTGAARAGVENLTKPWARMGEYGIRVNAVSQEQLRPQA